MSGSPSVSFSVGGGGRAGMLDATAAVADAGAVVPLSRGTPPVTKYRHPLSSPVATAHSHSLPALSASDPGTSGAVTAGTSLGHGTGGSELPMADRRTTDIDSSSASVVSSHFSLHSGSRGGFRNPSDGGSAAGRSTGRRHHSHSHRVSGKRDGPGPPGSHYLSLPDEDGSHGTSERADFDILDLPAEWMDPITHTLMMDPVRLADGCLCDRSSAAAWYARGHINNPRSGDILYDATLVPDDALRSQIHGLLETNPRIVQQSMQLYHRRFMEHAVRLREEDIASMFSKSHFGKRVHAGDGFWKAFDSPDFRRDQRGILADDVAAQLNAGDAHHGHHTGRSRHSSGAGGRSTSESSRGRHSGDPASERLTGGRTGHSGGGLGRGASRGSKRGASKIKRAAATRPMNEIEKAKSALSMSEDVRSFLSRLQCLMYEKTFTEWGFTQYDYLIFIKDDHLIEMGVPPGPRRAILLAVKQVRSAVQAKRRHDDEEVLRKKNEEVQRQIEAWRADRDEKTRLAIASGKAKKHGRIGGHARGAPAAQTRVTKLYNSPDDARRQFKNPTFEPLFQDDLF